MDPMVLVVMAQGTGVRWRIGMSDQGSLVAARTLLLRLAINGAANNNCNYRLTTLLQQTGRQADKGPRKRTANAYVFVVVVCVCMCVCLYIIYRVSDAR